MCLAVVGTIVAKEGDKATVDIEGNLVEVVTILVPEAGLSDHVLIHTGFAIAVISADDYQEHRRVFKEVAESAARLLDADQR